MAPAPAPTTVQVGPGVRVTLPGAPSSPSAVYEALREQRSELREQLENLEEKRQELQQQLGAEDMIGDARTGLVSRLKEVDARITAVDAQLAEADASVARAAAVPGAVVPPVPEPRDGPPEEVFVLGGIFMFVAVFPIVIAYARRIWKRGATVIAPVPQDVRDRLESLSHAVESIGLEVERIGEGQRFMTRVFTEQRERQGLGSGDR